MPVSHKHRAIFVHIPKTAGTSIYDALAIRKDAKHQYSGMARIPALQHLTPLQLRARMSPDKWRAFYKFTVVRNPFDRLVSDYRYLKPRLGARSSKYRAYLESFPVFVRLVASIVNSKAYTRNVFFDHFRPQSEYMEGITYDKICRFENVAADLLEVRERLGCDTTAPLPWVFCTSRVHGPQNYREYYDDKTRELASSVYAEDLARFQYEF